jgi:hypothetical protein
MFLKLKFIKFKTKLYPLPKLFFKSNKPQILNITIEPGRIKLGIEFKIKPNSPTNKINKTSKTDKLNIGAVIISDKIKPCFLVLSFLIQCAERKKRNDKPKIKKQIAKSNNLDTSEGSLKKEIPFQKINTKNKLKIPIIKRNIPIINNKTKRIL